jgi:hypothetical protein
MKAVLTLLLLPSLHAFTLTPVSHRQNWCQSSSVCFSQQQQPDENDASKEPPSLVLGDELKKVAGKYAASENVFLAAARERSKTKAASADRTATDADWFAAKREAQARGGEVLDDWENAKTEAGNMDSQILIPIDPSSGAAGDDDAEEPKLLLF